MMSDRRRAQRELDESLARRLGALTLFVAAFLLLDAGFHFVVGGTWMRNDFGMASLVHAAICLPLGLFLARRPVAPRYFSAFGALVIATLVGHALWCVDVSGNPAQTFYVLVIMFSATLAMINNRWFAALMLGTLFAWYAIAWPRMSEVAWWSMGFSMPMAAVMAQSLNWDRRRTNCRLLVARYRLERETAAAAEARAAAEVANQAKSAFLANVSHEIRSPMTAVLGFIDIFRDTGPLTAQQQDALDTISRNGRHLIEIINDILDLSRIEADQLRVERMACSPLDLIHEAVDVFRPLAARKGIDLSIALVEPLPESIATDPTRFRQIVQNLVGNAVKFSSEGEVAIELGMSYDADGPHLTIDVTDTGIGMSPAQVERLFQPFSQADASTTRRFGGSGLGLVISRRLARLLGGDVELVDTAPGQGSHFRITVATGALEAVRLVWNNQERPHEYGPGCPLPRGTTEVDLAGAMILLAEDGPDNQRLLAHILTKAKAEVTVVDNGCLAVEAARLGAAGGRPYDVILMDMQMPVMDGYDATRTLRAEGYRGIIIALTAHAMRDDRDKCLQAGCDEYLSKPIDRKLLVHTIARFRPAASATNVQVAAAAPNVTPAAHRVEDVAEPPLVAPSP